VTYFVKSLTATDPQSSDMRHIGLRIIILSASSGISLH